jgi:hypothetical protein
MQIKCSGGVNFFLVHFHLLADLSKDWNAFMKSVFSFCLHDFFSSKTLISWLEFSSLFSCAGMHASLRLCEFAMH